MTHDIVLRCSLCSARRSASRSAAVGSVGVLYNELKSTKPAASSTARAEEQRVDGSSSKQGKRAAVGRYAAEWRMREYEMLGGSRLVS